MVNGRSARDAPVPCRLAGAASRPWLIAALAGLALVSAALTSAVFASGAPAAAKPAAPPSLPGACPVGPENACTLDLTGQERPAVPAVCTADPWLTYLAFEQPDKISNSNGDAWWESVVRIRLDPARGCDCAVFRLLYESEPTGFTVNIGDSPTNDGFGGDAGTTPIAAEATVVESGLSVFTMFPVDQLLNLHLPALAGRTLTLRVCDQFLSFDLEKAQGESRPIQGIVDTLLLPRLFTLGRQPSFDGRAPPKAVDYDIFVGFNRVIHMKEGVPAKGRSGTGLKRVSIHLTP